jgi:DNA polymerase V
MFRSLYKPGAMYHRGGVLLEGLSSASTFQPDLLGDKDPAKFDREKRRMTAIDALNDTYGRKTVYLASEDLSTDWEPKKMIRSPRYATNWDELPKIGIV